MNSASILDQLFAVIEQRRDAATADRSYVKSLLEAGPPKIGAKIIEEAGEVVEASAENDPAHLTREIADLVFHVWVLLAASGLRPDAVYAELARRFGTSGLVEKASRRTGGTP